jgi:hypothetical protein
MNSIAVPAQTDAEYAAVSSNQCSWCAVEFALKRHSLVQAWLRRDAQAFLAMYKDCLAIASKKRKDLGQYLYGENIDSGNLLTHYNLNLVNKNTILLNTENGEFPRLLHPDLAAEFYDRRYMEGVSIEYILNRMPTMSYLLVSRHGQSLVVIHVQNEMYLILDSHLHIAQMMSSAAAAKHILMDEGGYTHVTLLAGI